MRRGSKRAEVLALGLLRVLELALGLAVVMGSALLKPPY